ncbi:YHYH domain-containing protein [Sporosarcina psychrophila]|uniref:YHYH domain-containing protein n=1 Tax=Sporosarcina psychrophila TaxID=1476 RepID=UPI00078D851E|nr:YHYH domain-containing protein [Sporosarcina psychrophila]AMQ07711.1 hypothetical protein AZE41_18180 [Sporosarcina psychrophila]
MKKVIVALSIAFLTFSIFASDAMAHPGRTDSSGGHTCRTNCAKWGYVTGEYHLHNGGTPKTSTVTTSKPKPKPAYSQADIDEGRSTGESQGYEEGYSRKQKVTQTTTGNEGYKKGYALGYEVGYNEGLKKVKEEDTVAGMASGEIDGKSSFRKGDNEKVPLNDSKSETWNNAYKTAYSKSFNHEKIVTNSEQSGHDLGYSLAKLVVPADYAKEDTLKTAFESHYKTGYEERTKEEKGKQLKLGSKDGYELAVLAVATTDDRFIESYNQGYEEGKLKRKEETLAEGYQSAFINMEFPVDEENGNQQLLTWNNEGFDSNKIAVQIKETAFENGHTKSEYFIPEEFEINSESIALYDSLFQEGQDQRAQEKQKKMMYTAGIGIPASGIIVASLLMKKRKKKKVI